MGFHLSLMLLFVLSGFLCLPASFPQLRRRPMSRGTPASENQSPQQTKGEHKGVNDKQMKGRISDTCSLPLFLLPASSLSHALQPVSFPVTAPWLPVCVFSAQTFTVRTEVDAGELRSSRSYKHWDGSLLSVCLSVTLCTE